MNSYVYIIYNPSNGLYKIGHSNDVEKRMKALKNEDSRAKGGKLMACFTYKFDNKSDARYIESKTHKIFSDKRIGRSEWFRFTHQDLREVSNSILCNNLPDEPQPIEALIYSAYSEKRARDEIVEYGLKLEDDQEFNKALTKVEKSVYMTMWYQSDFSGWFYVSTKYGELINPLWFLMDLAIETPIQELTKALHSLNKKGFISTIEFSHCSSVLYIDLTNEISKPFCRILSEHEYNARYGGCSNDTCGTHVNYKNIEKEWGSDEGKKVQHIVTCARNYSAEFNK